jgi:hypothetical protein
VINQFYTSLFCLPSSFSFCFQLMHQILHKKSYDKQLTYNLISLPQWPTVVSLSKQSIQVTRINSSIDSCIKARLHNQSFRKVWSKFIFPSYLSAVNSKTNKMTELDLDSKKMFWLVNSHQSPSKFLEK